MDVLTSVLPHDTTTVWWPTSFPLYHTFIDDGIDGANDRVHRSPPDIVDVKGRNFISHEENYARLYSRSTKSPESRFSLAD